MSFTSKTTTFILLLLTAIGRADYVLGEANSPVCPNGYERLLPERTVGVGEGSVKHFLASGSPADCAAGAKALGYSQSNVQEPNRPLGCYFVDGEAFWNEYIDQSSRATWNKDANKFGPGLVKNYVSVEDEQMLCKSIAGFSDTFSSEGNTNGRLSVGLKNACGIMQSEKGESVSNAGRIICWGVAGDKSDWSGYGITGYEPAGQDWVEVQLGSQWACALNNVGEITCWGTPHTGGYELNIENAPSGAENSNFKSLAIAQTHSCAVKFDDTLYCWTGQDAIKRENDFNYPTNDYVQSQGSEWAQCALRENHAVSCWSSHIAYRTNNAFYMDEYQSIENDYQSLSVGRHFACGLQFSGSVNCWNTNNNAWQHLALVQQPGPSEKFIAISAKGNFVCAIRTDTTIKCWGGGTGGDRDNTLQDNVPTGSGYVALSAGWYDACAMKSAYDGELSDMICWKMTAYSEQKVADGPKTTYRTFFSPERFARAGDPTDPPTSLPTANPTSQPTPEPTTASPTSTPTNRPTSSPTFEPTANPTSAPTLLPNSQTSRCTSHSECQSKFCDKTVNRPFCAEDTRKSVELGVAFSGLTEAKCSDPQLKTLLAEFLNREVSGVVGLVGEDVLVACTTDGAETVARYTVKAKSGQIGSIGVWQSKRDEETFNKFSGDVEENLGVSGVSARAWTPPPETESPTEAGSPSEGSWIDSIRGPWALAMASGGIVALLCSFVLCLKARQMHRRAKQLEEAKDFVNAMNTDFGGSMKITVDENITAGGTQATAPPAQGEQGEETRASKLKDRLMTTVPRIHLADTPLVSEEEGVVSSAAESVDMENPARPSRSSQWISEKNLDRSYVK